MTPTTIASARAWIAASLSGHVVRLPAGLKYGQQWRNRTGKPCSRFEEGATQHDLILGQNEKIEITIDEGGIEDLIRRALRSKGRRAQQGPVTVRRVR